MNPLSPTDAARTPAAFPRRHRLTRLSGFASWASFASATIVFFAACYLWLVDGALDGHLAGMVDGIITPPSQTTMAIAGAILMVPIALLIVVLVELGWLFRLFADGRVFEPTVPRRLGRIGWLAFSGAAAAVVSQTLVTLLMTSANPPGRHMLSIGIDSQTMAGAMFGFLFLVLSLVMQEALSLAEENRGFI